MPANTIKNDYQFIQRFERFGVAGGMSRSTASVLAHLTVCDPPQQTASEIQLALGLSAGSVSSALNTLRRVGLIQRNRHKDDRHYHYELDSEGWRRATLQKLKSLGAWVELAEYGLERHPKNTRLVEMRDVYLEFDKEFSDIARRLTR